MLSVIKNGIEHSLDNGTLCFLIGDDGWGMTPLHRLSERGPLQHGESDRGFRLDPRMGTVALFVVGKSRQDMYDKRQELLSIFSPGDESISLRWGLDNPRQIDCHVAGDMSMGSDNRSGFAQRLAVTLYCPDPTFYDPAAKTKVFSIGGSGDSMAIPLAIPMSVGSSTLELGSTLLYKGNWRSFPYALKISGPITDALVVNNSIGRKIDFTGVTIDAGDYRLIDLRYGRKTVVDSNGANKIAEAMVNGSDIVKWYLGTDPDVPGGVNDIRVSGTGVTEATTIQISYYERFLGI